MQQQTDSWWVGKEPVGFTKIAEALATHMSNKREARWVDGTRGIVELKGNGGQRAAVRWES